MLRLEFCSSFRMSVRVHVGSPVVPKSLSCRSIVARGTKLTRVAQYDLTAVQVDFSDVVQISRYSGELAGPAREVYGVGDDGVQTRGHSCRGGGGLDCAQVCHQHSADRFAMLVLVAFLSGCPCD